jgi:hypothetical protein
MKATLAAAMAPAASQPPAAIRHGRTKSPMIFLLVAISSSAAIIGAATTPFRTALQYRIDADEVEDEPNQRRQRDDAIEGAGLPAPTKAALARRITSHFREWDAWRPASAALLDTLRRPHPFAQMRLQFVVWNVDQILSENAAQLVGRGPVQSAPQFPQYVVGRDEHELIESAIARGLQKPLPKILDEAFLGGLVRVGARLDAMARRRRAFLNAAGLVTDKIRGAQTGAL